MRSPNMTSLTVMVTGIAIVTATIHAAPPTDDQVQQAINTYQKARDTLFTNGSAKMEDGQDLYRHALGELEAEELTISQIVMLYHAHLLQDREIRQTLAERVMMFVDDPSIDGAVARALRVDLVGGVVDPANRPDPAVQEELIGSMFAHDALAEAIRTGAASFVIEALDSCRKKSVWHTYRDKIYGLVDDLLACEDHRIAYNFEDYFEMLGHINAQEASKDAPETAPEKAEARRQEIRAELVVFARDVIQRADDGEIEIDKKKREFF